VADRESQISSDIPPRLCITIPRPASEMSSFAMFRFARLRLPSLSVASRGAVRYNTTSSSSSAKAPSTDYDKAKTSWANVRVVKAKDMNKQGRFKMWLTFGVVASFLATVYVTAFRKVHYDDFELPQVQKIQEELQEDFRDRQSEQRDSK